MWRISVSAVWIVSLFGFLPSLSLSGKQNESWRRRGLFAMPLKRTEEQDGAL